jgi:2-alkyl-3-oxoalkanoate reductase
VTRAAGWYSPGMRVLVTGATGFVGGAVVRRLLADGHTVHALVREQGAVGSLQEGGARPFVGHLGDPNGIARAASGCDAVVHAAGIASHRAHPEALEWVNVAGTENVLQAVRHAGVGRFVFISCADVTLGTHPRVYWNEDQEVPGEGFDAHARSKRLAEELVLCAAGPSFVPVALRPAILWGPGDTTTLPALCAEAARGRVHLFGAGTNLVSTTYIDHLADAVVAALTAEGVAGCPYYVTDGEFLEARELFGALCRAAGLPPPRRGAPFPLAYAAAWIRERMSGSGPWRTDVVRRARSTYLDHARAVNQLGYAPRVPFDEGMRRVAEWVEAVGGADAVTRLARPPDATNAATGAMAPPPEA